MIKLPTESPCYVNPAQVTRVSYQPAVKAKGWLIRAQPAVISVRLVCSKEIVISLPSSNHNAILEHIIQLIQGAES